MDLGLSFYYYAVTSKDANLCTYFILPLLGFNCDTLRGNFRNSYLSPTGYQIYVQVVIADIVKQDHSYLPEHRCIFLELNKQYLEYIIPEKWRPDVQLFIQGKYSKMSEEAKIQIKENSSLSYKELIKTSGLYSSDYRLIALERSEGLTLINGQISTDYNSESFINTFNEMLSPPETSSFLSF